MECKECLHNCNKKYKLNFCKVEKLIAKNDNENKLGVIISELLVK